MNREERRRARAALFAGLTGRAVPGGAQDTRSQLLAAYGTDNRGRPNTRAAAAALGVSQRTVQRWITTTGRQRNRPRPDHAKALATRARQAASTKLGRTNALKTLAGDRASRHGASLTTRGIQGVRSAGRDYTRPRTVTLDLNPDQVQALRMAYIDSGDTGALRWLEAHFDREYAAGWGFDSLDSMNLGPR